MGSIHINLFLHTAVRWLSRGKVFVRVFEMRQEIYIFLKEQNHDYAKNFVDPAWLCRLAYLADIFSRINDLNLTMQGNNLACLKLYFQFFLFY
jgi:zinc finger BED domain-containing protein 5/7/8/9